MIKTTLAVLVVSAIAGGRMSSTVLAQAADRTPCELPEATQLLSDGSAVLQRWEVPDHPVWFSEALPQSPGYAAYRAAVRAAGSDQPRPAVDVSPAQRDADRELWRREETNVAKMYAGAGEVRAVRCLEAALFALQDARYSQLAHPTEFVAHLLRKDDRLRIYFGASSEPIPPKRVYGIDEAATDVAAGWRYLVVLHNHTLQRRDGTSTLGVPVPSTSDVSLFAGLVARLGLREVWVTNGMYTGVVSAEKLATFVGRE